VRRSTLRRLVLGSLAAAVALPLLYDFTVTRVGIGSFTYVVRIVSPVPVHEVRYQSFPSPEWAEEAVHFKSVDRREPVQAGLRDGDRFYLSVTFYDRESGLRWRYSYVQHRYLLVVATLADGGRVEKLVELPDVRESREVTVALD
jgi:hypothetical protein